MAYFKNNIRKNCVYTPYPCIEVCKCASVQKSTTNVDISLTRAHRRACPSDALSVQTPERKTL